MIPDERIPVVEVVASEHMVKDMFATLDTLEPIEVEEIDPIDQIMATAASCLPEQSGFYFDRRDIY